MRHTQAWSSIIQRTKFDRRVKLYSNTLENRIRIRIRLFKLTSTSSVVTSSGWNGAVPKQLASTLQLQARIGQMPSLGRLNTACRPPGLIFSVRLSVCLFVFWPVYRSVNQETTKKRVNSLIDSGSENSQTSPLVCALTRTVNNLRN